MQEFEFLQPSTLAEVVTLMDQYGDACKVVAGGTDIIPALREDRLAGVTTLIDIRRRPELRGIERRDAGVWIGAATTHSEIEQSPEVNQYWPLLVEACGQIGSRQIRNLATLGGNVANASPAADSIPALLCLDAQVSLLSTFGKRETSLQIYLLEKKQSQTLRAVLLEGFFLPYPLPNTLTKFVKVARRQAMAISRLSLAIALHIEAGVIDLARIVPGAMLPITQRLTHVEGFLVGKRLSSEVSSQAAKLASEQVIAVSGRRSSFKYKIPVLEGLIEQVLDQCQEGVGDHG